MDVYISVDYAAADVVVISCELIKPNTMKTLYVVTQHKVSGAGHESNVICCTDSLCEAKELDVKEGYYNTIHAAPFKKSHKTRKSIPIQVLKAITVTSATIIFSSLIVMIWTEAVLLHAKIILTGMVAFFLSGGLHDYLIQKIRQKESDI